jgi:hypothetical protein
MLKLLTLPARCFLELLRGIAEGPGYRDPADPFQRKPETRAPQTDTKWWAGAMPMGKTSIPWWKQKPPTRDAAEGDL